ncbi:F-box protein At2g32560-like isoform X2 [Prosopis cineraria]|uniref:F-box protein At2g32560-like isoform X2 n=1 Tax=Prosopis cineraria TaxID=364024 RepID=UPI00240EF74C|nr:F-box protein At2g32560-like isoform X2 [Prosopis cineraria]
MFYFLISFLSFLILSKSFTSKPLSLGFWLNLSSSSIFGIKKCGSGFSLYKVPLTPTMPLKKKISASKLDDEGEAGKISLLDLPELPLESILERLSPAELCSVSAVCKSLRDRCQSDYLWKRLMKKKWGKIIGDSAYRQWLSHIASINTHRILHQRNLFGSFSWIKPKSQNGGLERRRDSAMALYISLTSGKFWFPAQVYNRENGHAGFMLSCYDAQLCYDSGTDTFQARYSPHGRWAEENIPWERLRMPPIDISPHVLYTSDCLADLRPGDHVEIQWRRNKEFPYGWWYGVIGHLKSCAEHGNHCCCHLSDTVILEFKQYNAGSRWRQTVINRKHHREEGNEVDGFYGGIRKIHNEDEIARWNNLWPIRTVE